MFYEILMSFQKKKTQKRNYFSFKENLLPA